MSTSTLIAFKDFAHQVFSASEHCRDQRISSVAMVFHALDLLEIEGELFPVTLDGQKMIAHRLDIPFSYLKRCDPCLQAENLNIWLKRNQNQEFLIRFDKNKVRAIFTTRYEPMDHRPVLNILSDMGVSPQCQVQGCFNDRMMFLSVPDASQYFALAGDDGYLPGISVINSEVGASALHIRAFLLRLVCTNGLVSPKETFCASYRHVGRRVRMELPGLFQYAVKSAKTAGHRFLLGRDRFVDSPQDTMARFNRQFRLTSEERQAVTWGYGLDPGYSLFHIANAYTKASQQNSLTPESTLRLQQVGGTILAMTH